MIPDDPIAPEAADRPGPAFPWWIPVVMASILLAGGLAYFLLGGAGPPAPPEVARDPLLSRGRTIYLGRCVACHGLDGKGDGPIAKHITGPPPGNLTDEEWKHGAQPEQVIRVIAEGVPNTQMNGWDRALDPADIRAVAAYVYYLAKRPVPDTLRAP